MRSRLSFLFTILLALLSLCACGKQEYSGEAIEFWLVTEESQGAGMNQQAEMVMEKFREIYPNVTLRMDILPQDEEARDAYLKKIRSEIMSGGGPDLYLMPTAPQPYPEYETGTTPYMEPLFSNVPQQMYNGIFTDISQYYDADDTLGKDELVTGVMDAGVMDGARYVLPLRFDYDVLLVARDVAAEMGIDLAVVEGGIDDLYALAEQLQNEYAAHGLTIPPRFINTSGYIDFQTENILTDAQELADLINAYYHTIDLSNPEAHKDAGEYWGDQFMVFTPGYRGYECSIDAYIGASSKKYRIFSTAGYPFMSIGLHDLIDAAAAIKIQDQKIDMYPVRAADGDLVAEITYYGAVGSGCKYPEIAYEFLRLFYSEELQWEQYPPRNAGKDLGRLAEEGYPVRAIGSAEPFYENIRVQLEMDQLADKKMKNYTSMRLREPLLNESFTVTDEDLPILSTPVDEARFPVITADSEFFSRYISQIETAEDAQRMIDDLQWLLAEG